MRVLLVEDELQMASLIRRGLLEEGLAVDVAASGEDALWMARRHAVRRDRARRDAAGRRRLRGLPADPRRGVRAPVLMLTARDAVEDRVAGLDAGADDYLVKPFAFAELLARLRALARRGELERPGVLEVGDLRLDPATRRVCRGGPRDPALGQGVRAARGVHAPARRGALAPQLLEHAWDFAYENRSNVIDVYVSHLRDKIDEPFGRQSLETVRGAGYRLRRDARVSRLPIRLRVAAAFAVAMAAVLVLSGAFLYVRLGSHLSLALDRQLRQRANDLAVLVSRPGTPLQTAHRSRFVECGESFAEVLSRRGRCWTRPRRSAAHPLLSAAEMRRALRRRALHEPGRCRASTNRRASSPPTSRGAGRRLVLVVGITREDRAETLRSLRDELLIAGPIALLLATLAGYVLAGLALRPVETMRRRAAAISAETPGERLPVRRRGTRSSGSETTLNAMLARLEARCSRERTFVADAGHELRTPLALLRTELELALRHGEDEAELRAALQRSSEEVDRLTQLAEALLLIARSDRGQLQLRLEDLEPVELLTSTVTRFEWRAGEAGRSVSVAAAPGLNLRGDRMRLEQALGNLVENALRHGAGDVTLSAAGEDGVVELHVRDDGNGFPPDFIADAFTRFARPDHGRSGAGSGLGLSIVRTIAEAHGGSARAANSRAAGPTCGCPSPTPGLPRPPRRVDARGRRGSSRDPRRPALRGPRPHAGR